MSEDTTNFVGENKGFIFAHIIELKGKTTIEQYGESMRWPKIWESQVEIQAAMELYGAPLYLYIQTPENTTCHLLGCPCRLS